MKIDIFTDKNDFNQFLPVPNTFELSNQSTYLRQAFNNYIKEHLSVACYEDLYTKFKADTLNDLEQDAFYLIKQSLSLFSFLKAIPFIQTNITDNGIRIVSREGDKTAFQWQVNEIKANIIEQAYDALEELHVFLLTNADQFTAYQNSEVYALWSGRFIQKSEDFTAFLGGKTSTYIFHLLKHNLEMKHRKLRTVLGNALYLDIENKIKLKTLSDIEKKLVKEIKPALALSLYADGVRDLRLFVGNDGVVKKRKTNEDNRVEALKDEEVQTYLKKVYCDVEEQWDQVKEFLTTNAASFPLFEVKEQVVRNLNDNDRGFFVGM